MFVSLVLAAAVALQAASPSPAATTAAKPAPSSKTIARADEEKPICEMMDVTGSIFQRKVCLTRSEWDRMTSGSQDFMRQNTGAATQIPLATH